MNELCFYVTFEAIEDEDKQEALWYSFIEEVVEKNDLYYGGGHHFDYFTGCLDFSESKASQEFVKRELQQFFEINTDLLTIEFDTDALD